MERIRNKVEMQFSSSYGLAISAGIISLEPDQDVKDLLIIADRALYKAKAQKNSVITIANRTCWYGENQRVPVNSFNIVFEDFISLRNWL